MSLARIEAATARGAPGRRARRRRPSFAVARRPAVDLRGGARRCASSSRRPSRAGREVYAIALSTQIQIEPAKRTLRRRRRASGSSSCSARPSGGRATTHSFQWARVEALVPGFTGRDVVRRSRCRARTTSRSRRRKYLYALRDGEVPLAFHFTGMVLYRGERDRLQVVPVPWSCIAELADAGRGVAARRSTRSYPGGGWVRLPTETLDALGARKAARRAPQLRRLRARELLEEATA